MNNVHLMEGNMNKKEQSKNTFNLQANKYDTTFYSKHAKKLYPFILNEIIRIDGLKVLDLGCGTGALIAQVISEDSHRLVTGIDISEKMIEVARQKLGNKATLVVGDSEILPFDDQTFDVVYCNDSFHHYPNPQKVIAEVARVLKDGGGFIIGDTYLPIVIRQIMNTMIKYNHGGDVRIYSKSEITALLTKQFHQIKWQKISNKAYLVKGIK